MKILTKIGLIAVLAAMMVSSPVAAQSFAGDFEAISAATRFSLPHVFEGFMRCCSDDFDPRGYAVRNRDRLLAKFEYGSEENWPAARKLEEQELDRREAEQ